MVTGWQVTPHHQDPVTAGLTCTAGRQQPEPPGAGHRERQDPAGQTPPGPGHVWSACAPALLSATRSSRHRATACTVNGARITRIRWWPLTCLVASLSLSRRLARPL